MRMHLVVAFMVLAGVSAASAALDVEKAEKLFMEHCAVCHGADRGGYIGPALNHDETKLDRGQVTGKILAGIPPTLMPQHPSWPGTLAARERDMLAEL
ncbi:MAG TPA: c-type cytochrome, partial [Pseudomonadales bacterium]|nr:c-type cytochrome [Pseudomonadales bacterium]